MTTTITPPARLSSSKITLQTLRQRRAARMPIAMLTAYDFPTAKILQEAGVPVLLVGDSAAMTMLGLDSTVHATMDFLMTITAAVRRGAPQVFLMGDMPFASYADAKTGVENAARFMQQAGADAVKVEADGRHEAIIAAMSAAGVPVCAHLGLLPQRVAQQGGYRAKGRTRKEAERIIADAVLLTKAGAEMLLLEAVPDEVSAEICRRVDVPVFGCGAGPSCDGHVVVIHDMLGYNARVPKFVDVLGDVPHGILQAAQEYVRAVESREYPAQKHGYLMKNEE